MPVSFDLPSLGGHATKAASYLTVGLAGASGTYQKAWEGSYIRYILDTLFTMASIERPIGHLEAGKAMFRVVLDGRLGPDHPATKATLP